MKITYDDYFFRIDGKLIPLYITKLDEATHSVEAFWLGAIKALPIDPNDFSPRISLEIPKTEVFFVEGLKESYSLEMVQDLQIMGDEYVKGLMNAIRYKKLYFNPEYKELWEFIKKQYREQPLKDKPIDKIIEVCSKMSDIDKDFEKDSENNLSLDIIHKDELKWKLGI